MPNKFEQVTYVFVCRLSESWERVGIHQDSSAVETALAGGSRSVRTNKHENVKHEAPYITALKLAKVLVGMPVTYLYCECGNIAELRASLSYVDNVYYEEVKNSFWINSLSPQKKIGNSPQPRPEGCSCESAPEWLPMGS